MSAIYSILNNHWQPTFTLDHQEAYADALENGKVLHFSELDFSLSDEEKKVLSSNKLSLKSKNISYNSKTREMKGVLNADPGVESLLKGINARFYDYSSMLIQHLFPFYYSKIIPGMTSLRPVEVRDRTVKSIKKDDTRLHVDAFPSRPNQGKRILRVFSNINFEGLPRVWRVGESMQLVCDRFYPKLKKPLPGIPLFCEKLKITKGYRTRYDSYMLQLHDKMKFDQHYQNTVSFEEIAFQSGSTWVVFTDSVSHAALSGKNMMEQTFYLPVDAMRDPALSPLKILESLAGRELID